MGMNGRTKLLRSLTKYDGISFNAVLGLRTRSIIRWLTFWVDLL